MLRLLIGDDHLAVRQGVMTMLLGTEIEVAAQAASCEQTVKYTLTCEPDVVLVDMRLPDEDGLQALRRIKNQRPETLVLMFSAFESMSTMVRAFELGAAGYLCKGIDRKKLIEAIRRAGNGKRAWTRRQLRQIGTARRSVDDSHDNTDIGLTARQRQILGKLVEGLSNEEIAESLSVDVETVKQHVKRLLTKLGVVDRTQAALWALHNGWKPPH
jgi:DNA-binding NarL/FixJ family response regulator